jgi:two-component system OmpR family sensor kinase
LERPTTVSLRAAATDAINANIGLARAKDIDLGLERVDDADVVLDASSVTVVLRNLVDNAVRYTPDGGKVDGSVVQAEREIMFEVVDSGAGIRATNLSVCWSRSTGWIIRARREADWVFPSCRRLPVGP